MMKKFKKNFASEVMLVRANWPDGENCDDDMLNRRSDGRTTAW